MHMNETKWKKPHMAKEKMLLPQENTSCHENYDVKTVRIEFELISHSLDSLSEYLLGNLKWKELVSPETLTDVIIMGKGN
ncbi:hypothetical protein ABEB36_011017 [Hypothenemus hampei]|uniref:Uncharacterized protein n=1 Tax=Hypothenemus hampei TaxID=57062 RepID=A0ABD1EEG4_HYPHA